MSVTVLDLVIQQGDDFSKAVPVLDQSGNPADITGYSASMQIRPTAGSSVTLLSLSSPSTGITLQSVPGVVTITITHAQTAALWPQPCVYDLTLTDPSGNVARFLTGDITITPAVTR